MRNETLKYLYWVLGSTVMVLFLVGLAAFRNLEQAQEYGKLVNHTTGILRKAEESISLIKDAETGVRGYLLTRDLRFTEPYSRASLKVWPSIRALDTLTLDNPQQRAPIRRLDTLTKRSFEIMEQSIRLFISTQKQDSLKGLMLEGKTVMDSIRLVVKEIQQKEQKLLTQRQKREDELSTLTPFWLGLISLLAVGLFLASFLVVITELRRRWHYESQLEQAVAELKKTNDELENFVYLTSHHFQEPLRKLQTFSGRLIGKHRLNLAEDAVFMLNRIHDSAARMQQLMDDLLQYLRFGSAGSSSTLQETPLLPILKNVLNDQTAFLESTQMPAVEWAIGETTAVWGNHTQLQAMFQQLFDNSLKFARQNIQPVIKIRTFVIPGSAIPGVSKKQLKDKFCKVEFSDNGIGFNTDYTEKIFQLFQRLHHQHEYPGTGIGLAICQKVIANHHGYLEVKSQVGEGTTFYIYLPISG